MIYLLQQNSRKKRKVVNRDLAGGFGTATHFGDSFLSRLLTFSKRKTVKLAPFNLVYVASVLKNNDREVKYVEDLSEICADAKIAIIASSIVDFNSDIGAATELRRRFGKGIKIGFVGTFASIRPELFLPYADFVITGEAENFFFKNRSFNLDDLKGIINAGLVENLEELPFPAWELFEYKKYSYFPTLKGRPFFPILSSRGCVFSCAHYCPYPLMAGRVWRVRGVKNVVDEIERLAKKFGAKAVLFRDPIFTFDKERAAGLAREIIARKIEIEWACETRLDFLHEELLDLLYESGLRGLNVGIESFSEEVLMSSRRKPIEKEHQEKVIKYCHGKGIRVSAFYIIGLAEDTEETILQTIDYAKYLNTNTAQFTIYTPYPGTAFYEEVKDLIFEKDWEKFDAYTPVWRMKNITPKRLLELKDYAHRNYYFRFKWLKMFFKNNLRFW